ncbi:MAG: hypothetical protein AVDCRST_MAG23-228, partial [uncultured Sphingosinicella sp.]
ERHITGRSSLIYVRTLRSGTDRLSGSLRGGAASLAPCRSLGTPAPSHPRERAAPGAAGRDPPGV